MKVLIDTNVILESLCDRELAQESQKLMEAIDEGLIEGCINSGSFSNITYIAERQLKKKGMEKPKRVIMLREILSDMLATFTIVAQGNDDLMEAVGNPNFDDIEDSFQYQAFKTSGCEYLVTINLHDFPYRNDGRIVHLTDFVRYILPTL